MTKCGEAATKRVQRFETRANLAWLRCGKRPVTAVPGACAVRGFDPEMVCGAPAQPADVCANTLVRVPDLALGGSGVPVAGRRAILEIHGRGQSMRVD